MMIDSVILIVSIILIVMLIRSIRKEIAGQGCCSDCRHCSNCKKHIDGFKTK